MPDTSMVLTEQAVRNIGNMRHRVMEISDLYGHESEEALEAARSLLDCLLTVFRFGGRVMAEDDLSLLIDSYITIGIVWFPRRIGEQRDPLVGCWSAHS